MAELKAEGAEYPVTRQPFDIKPSWFVTYEQLMFDKLQEIKCTIQNVETNDENNINPPEKEVGAPIQEMESAREDPAELQKDLKTNTAAMKKQKKIPFWQKSTNLENYISFTGTFQKFEDKDRYRKILNAMTESPAGNAQEKEHHYWIQTADATFDKTRNRLQPVKELLQFMTDNFKIKT